MTVYRGRRKGTWRVVLWHHGRRHERIVEGTKTDATAYELRLRHDLAAREPSGARVAPTFLDFSTGRYQAHARAELRASTWANRRYEIAELCDHFGDMRLTQITTAEVDAWRTERARDVSRRSVNRELMALSAVLSYARHVGVPCADPEIRKLRVSSTRRHAEAWTHAEVQRLYAACEKDEPELLPMVVFLLNTGARKSEAIALRWSEVDVKRRVVRIWPRTDDGDAFDTKSGEPREVPINDTLFPWLARSPRRHEWVFATRSGRRFAEFPKRRFGRVVKAAKLTGGAHKCRHTYATHFLESTPDLYLLGRMLGQEHTAVTELYSHLLPAHQERARAAVALAPTLGPAGVEARRKWRRAPPRSNHGPTRLCQPSGRISA